MNGDRSLPAWALPVSLGILVIGLVAIALLRGPTELDPNTPEGTVQQYLLAVDGRRWDDVVEILHPQWRGACEGEDLETFHVDDFTAELGRSDGFGGSIVSREFEAVVEVDGPLPSGTEFVEVTIHHTDQFGSSWDEWAQFELVEEDDFWWIVGEPWPYFVWNCRGR